MRMGVCVLKMERLDYVFVCLDIQEIDAILQVILFFIMNVYIYIIFIRFKTHAGLISFIHYTFQ